MPRVLFLGQKWIGERCFEALLHHDGNFEVTAVVTNLDKTVWWGSAAVAESAAEVGIPVLANDVRREAELAALAGEADVLLSVQHPWILTKPLREVDLALNLHVAKLPEYAGHNACNHVILNEEPVHVATIHHMVPDVDAGPIAYESTVEVDADETARSLYEKGIEAGVKAFRELLDDLAAGREPPRTEQVGTQRFFPRASLDELRPLRADLGEEELERRTRALYFPPFEPAYTLAAGRKVYALPARFAEFAHAWPRGFGR